MAYPNCPCDSIPLLLTSARKRRIFDHSMRSERSSEAAPVVRAERRNSTRKPHPLGKASELGFEVLIACVVSGAQFVEQPVLDFESAAAVALDSEHVLIDDPAYPCATLTQGADPEFVAQLEP